ncbi:MAG: zf-HC2 domain-containing protein [Gemmatimonadetes bacterium]|nr:zf-HC2 domain-containing protein [Gemmatimonadota bacterium]
MSTMSGIACEAVMARLWAFIDGELELASEIEVREHLEACERCYPQFDFQHAYFRLMRRLAAQPAPPIGLRASLLERLRALA